MLEPLVMDRAHIQFTVYLSLFSHMVAEQFFFKKNLSVLWVHTLRASVLPLMNCMILIKFPVSGCWFCNQPVKGIFNICDLTSIIPLLDKYLKQTKKLWGTYIDSLQKTEKSYQLKIGSIQKQVLRTTVYGCVVCALQKEPGWRGCLNTVSIGSAKYYTWRKGCLFLLRYVVSAHWTVFSQCSVCWKMVPFSN